MKRDDVPQQNAKAFMGHSKLLYAQNENGDYVRAPSNGWEAEEIVLDQAIEEFEFLAETAWKNVKKGHASTLEYYMYRERMDVVLLAQSTGYCKRRVRRHLKPAVFAKLKTKHIARYADALGLAPKALKVLPEKP